jgi:hypothetical protein
MFYKAYYETYRKDNPMFIVWILSYLALFLAGLMAGAVLAHNHFEKKGMSGWYMPPPPPPYDMAEPPAESDVTTYGPILK